MTQQWLEQNPETFSGKLYNPQSGQFAPPAGGFVDMKTGSYMPPPPGSAFDPIAGVYVSPAGMGTFQPGTGAFVPPAGMMMDPDKGVLVSSNDAAALARVTAMTNGTSPGNFGGAMMGTNPAMMGTNPAAGIGFGGMNPTSFGTGMVAAPPPPGMSGAEFTAQQVAHATANGGVYVPPAANMGYNAGAMNNPGSTGMGGMTGMGGTTGDMMGGGTYNSGVPYVNGSGQPQYPSYNPVLCPPYCDPVYQPGSPTTGGGSGGGTVATSTLSITIN